MNDPGCRRFRRIALWAALSLALLGAQPPSEQRAEPQWRRGVPGQVKASLEPDQPTAEAAEPSRGPAPPPTITSGTTVEWGPYLLSAMGPVGDKLYDAHLPKAAYNPSDDEYLVIWCGDDSTPPLVNDEFEIFGHRIDAGTGSRIGGRIRISLMGVDGDTRHQGCSSDVSQWFTRFDVVYNPTGHEYLAVWSGDGAVDEKFEIFGQRLDAATGAPVGGNFKIGSMGQAAETNYDAYDPAVAYNSTDEEYLVVWFGDYPTAPHIDGEFEIFGQRLNAATGAKLGPRLEISEQGEPFSSYRADWDAVTGDLAYDPNENRFLVVWQGADLVVPCFWPCVGDNYVWFEIFAQPLEADGTEIGGDAQISLMTSAPNVHHYCNNQECRQGFEPTVAYNREAEEFLVVWRGDDHGRSGWFEYEIHGQRVAGATGAEVGIDDFQISSMGPDGTSSGHDAYTPALTYNAAIGEYFVVWWADDDSGSLVEDEFEIFGQRLAGADASEVGDDDFRISEMGADADTALGAYDPVAAANTGSHVTAIFWHGDNDAAPSVNDEYEIWGECHGAPGSCGYAADLELYEMILRSGRTFTACSTIAAGDGFQVADGGDVVFRAGESIVLHDGFAVDSGGRFEAVVDPHL